MNKPTDIISRMEAMQQRFGRLQLVERTIPKAAWIETPVACYLVGQVDRPESERQILRCAPPFDAQAEQEADLRYESRVDYESWQYDGPEEREDA